MENKNKENYALMFEQMSLDVRTEMARNDLCAADIPWVIGALENRILNDIPIR